MFSSTEFFIFLFSLVSYILYWNLILQIFMLFIFCRIYISVLYNFDILQISLCNLVYGKQ